MRYTIVGDCRLAYEEKKENLGRGITRSNNT